MQGNSGFLHGSEARDAMARQQEKLAENFPAIEIEGHLLHVFQEGDGWCVWLNTECMEFDGLCIGVGETRDLAIAMAVAVCEAVEAELQKPSL